MGDQLTMTLIGGPTVLIEWRGLRLLTDPTFDPPGDFPLGPVTLTKLEGPAVAASQIGPIDAVLLSHDQHADNLDGAGRALLPTAGRVLTTPAGAARLGGNALGLAPWESIELATPGGGSLRVTATPARHGPEGCEPVSGDVAGFVLSAGGGGEVYVTGDTVWYDGVAEVSHRFPNVRLVLLFAGAARVPMVGPSHLTMDASDAVATARAFPNALIVPAHFAGWGHFSEGRAELEAAFAGAGLAGRLRWPAAGARLAT